jgi:hypothetical protein
MVASPAALAAPISMQHVFHTPVHGIVACPASLATYTNRPKAGAIALQTSLLLSFDRQ